MSQALLIHPHSVCTAVQRIEVEAARPRSGELALRYIVTGHIGELLMPDAATAARTEGLWRHTCFEAFVTAPANAGYCEFNFAPSAQWAAYAFSNYRDGMRNLAIGPPRIDVRSDAQRHEMTVLLNLAQAPLPDDAPWRLGLSAVIQEGSGGISYWALAHTPGKPDFHHSDCFTLELAAPEPA